MFKFRKLNLIIFNIKQIFIYIKSKKILMMKKGQISIFIILFVIIIISFIFISNNNTEEKKNKIKKVTLIKDEDIISPIKDYIQSCLKRQSNHALNWVLMQNGIYEKGKFNETPNIPKLIQINFKKESNNNSKIIYFDKNDVSKSIKLYLEDTMPYCLNNFIYFENYNIKSSIDETYVVEDLGNSILIEFEKEIQVENNFKKSSINKFRYEIEDINLELIETNVNYFLSQTNKFSNLEINKSTYNNSIYNLNSENLSIYIIGNFSSENKVMSFIFKYGPENYRETYFIFDMEGITENE